MVDFLLKQDIMETTIKNTVDEFKLTNEEVYKFIDVVNGYYLDECLELGVDEEDIFVYDPSVDVEDLRYGSLVKLCRWWFLEEVLFAYTTSEDSAKWLKYKEAQKQRLMAMSKLNYNRIIGEKPAIIKTSNVMVIPKHIGII